MVETTKSKQFHHVEWIDLEGKGVLTECAIMKKSPDGDIYFFALSSLDAIDKQRLFNILTNRNAHMYELWDLMSQVTLGNGINALTYFHQLVQVVTPSGHVMNPSAGRVGARTVAKPAGKGKGKNKVVAEEVEDAAE